jgi:hypothetical protein
VSTVIRSLEDADVETVVAFSLRAWAPVSASLEAELGQRAADEETRRDQSLPGPPLGVAARFRL